MLWSLAAAAACGVLAMLTASYDTLGRVSATAFATAVAAGVAWALGGKLEHPSFRHSRYVGIGSTVICYLFVLLGIWDVVAEEAWFTALATGMAGAVATVCLRGRLIDHARVAAHAGLAIAVLAWLASLVSIWAENHQDKWIGTALALAGFGALAATCLVSITSKPSGAFRWLGIAVSALAGTILVLDIWDWIVGSEFVERTIIVLASAGLVVAHANLCLLAPLRATQLWLRAATIAAAVLTAVCVDALTIFEIRGDSLVGRLAGAAAIAMGCGTLALAVFLRYNRATSIVDDAGTEITEITIMCPRCQSKQTVALGDVCCSHCQLRLNIHIDTAPIDSARSGIE